MIYELVNQECGDPRHQLIWVNIAVQLFGKEFVKYNHEIASSDQTHHSRIKQITKEIHILIQTDCEP